MELFIKPLKYRWVQLTGQKTAIPTMIQRIFFPRVISMSAQMGFYMQKSFGSSPGGQYVFIDR